MVLEMQAPCQLATLHRVLAGGYSVDKATLGTWIYVGFLLAVFETVCNSDLNRDVVANANKVSTIRKEEAVKAKTTGIWCALVFWLFQRGAASKQREQQMERFCTMNNS